MVADGLVAGRSPQFCASQLRSHNLTVHAISCQYARYGASKHNLTNEELRSGGEGVSYIVQSGAQTLTSSTATCHPKDCRRVICLVSTLSRKLFLKIGFLLDTNNVRLRDYARHGSSMRTGEASGSRLPPHRYPTIRIWLHDSERYGIFLAGLLWTVRELRAKWRARNWMRAKTNRKLS